MATILARYNTAASFEALLTRIGVSERQRLHLTDDEFTTMMSIVEFFQFSDIKQITTYFDDVNKTYANSSRREARVRFPPRVIAKISGVIWYLVHCVYSLHTIPDIARITMDQTVELGRLAREGLDPDPSSDDVKSSKDLAKARNVGIVFFCPKK